jgi:hypothetical protein
MEQGFHCRQFLPSATEHVTVILELQKICSEKEKILDKTGVRLEKSPGAGTAWSAVSLGDEVNDPGFESWQGKDVHLFFKTSGPISLLLNGYRGSFLRVNRPRCEVDYSLPSNCLGSK